MFGLLTSALSGLFSGGAGSKSTTDQSYNSETKGKSKINRTEFSSSIIKALEGLFGGGALEKNNNAVNSALTGQLATVTKDAKNPFDVSAFVNGVMKGAKNTANNELARGINSAEMATGGTTSSNSMAALTANKMTTDTASQLAGIRAQATAQGEQIAQQGAESTTNQVTSLTGSLNKNLMDFLSILRGAKTSQSQTSSETTEGTGTSSTEQPFNWMSGLGGMFGAFKPPAA